MPSHSAEYPHVRLLCGPAVPALGLFSFENLAKRDIKISEHKHTAISYACN